MGAVADARTAVASAIMGASPDLVVEAYPRMVDQPVWPTATMVVERVEPAVVACPDVVVTLALWLLVPVTDQVVAWDRLEALLDDVLAALDVSVDVTWTEATTTVWADTHPAYRITLEVRST